MHKNRATPETAKVLMDLVRSRLEKPKIDFLGDCTESDANPVFVMGEVEKFLVELEALVRFTNLQEACEALSRGCTWRDYDGKKWTK